MSTRRKSATACARCWGRRKPDAIGYCAVLPRSAGAKLCGFALDLASEPEQAETCILRTLSALRQAGLAEQYDLLRLRDMSDVSRRAMEESHLVSRDLLRSPETAAVLVKRDSSVSIMMNEDDHLRIQAVRTGDDLLSAAQACFCVDDALSRQNEFAFDQQLGYLTAFPTNAGTGMRASLLLHLPLLTRSKQMGNVGQMVAKVGLNIRGVYGEEPKRWATSTRSAIR